MQSIIYARLQYPLLVSPLPRGDKDVTFFKIINLSCYLSSARVQLKIDAGSDQTATPRHFRVCPSFLAEIHIGIGHDV